MSALAYDLEPRTLTPRCQHSGSLDFNTGTSQRPPSRESMNEQSTGNPRHPPSATRPASSQPRRWTAAQGSAQQVVSHLLNASIRPVWPRPVAPW